MGVFLFRHFRSGEPEGVSPWIGEVGEVVRNTVQDDFISLGHLLAVKVHQAERTEDPLQRPAFLQARDGMEAGVEPEPFAGESLETSSRLRGFLQDGDVISRPG